MPAQRPVPLASSPPRKVKANCRPGRYKSDAPPDRSDAATTEQQDYINAETLRRRLIELNP